MELPSSRAVGTTAALGGLLICVSFAGLVWAPHPIWSWFLFLGLACLFHAGIVTAHKRSGKWHDPEYQRQQEERAVFSGLPILVALTLGLAMWDLLSAGWNQETAFLMGFGLFFTWNFVWRWRKLR